MDDALDLFRSGLLTGSTWCVLLHAMGFLGGLAIKSARKGVRG